MQARAASASLVGYWAFDEAAGAAVQDSTPFANAGTIHGASWVAGGISGSALFFDGVGAYVQIPDASQYDGTDAVSVEAWIRMDPAQSYAQPNVLDKSHRSIDAPPYFSGYTLQCGSAIPNALNFAVCDGGSCAEASAGVSLADDRWHFVVGTASRTSGFLRFYLDGVMTQELPFTGPVAANAGDLFIGRIWLPAGRFFHGSIDEVKLYEGELTPEDVAAHFERMQPVRLVGHWAFDEGSGPTARDSSSYGNDGTLLGAAWNPNGVSGSALSFDGASACVQIPGAAQYDITDALSVEAWIRMAPDQAYEQPSVLDKSHRSYPAPDFSGYTFQGALGGSQAMNFVVGNGSTFTEAGSVTPLNDDRWHFIAATASTATGVVRYFLDGAMTQEVPFTGPLAINDGDLFVGRFWGPQARFFHGSIDEVKVYRGALTPAQVSAHYVSRVTGVPEVIASAAPLGPPSTWPNPGRTRVLVEFPAFGTAERANRVSVFDLAGRLLRVLPARKTSSGAWRTSWDCRDRDGRLVQPGSYLMRLSGAPTAARVVVVR